ncbi:hypothetical protein B0O80DRAFT_506855 [Mortierella sp. GBAus27b]|nr:hypothetical protein BGX31_006195 [Mortierella sp. GBA43]KAI8356012.1 hypothetical protein B0O80DRAFT_506855 [Mortierella sp. GBAus27b]
MFNLPELSDLVYLQLGRGDLARCARVNKKWYHGVIPYLWNDIAILRSNEEAAFFKLIVEDFLHERWHQHTRQTQRDVDQYSQPPSPPFSPTLTKYARYIQKTPEPEVLLSCFSRLSCIEIHQPQPTIEESYHPSPYELLRHFYKRCRNIRLDSIQLSPEDFESDLWEIITKDVVLHVRHLVIKKSSCHTKVHSWKLKCLLDRLSATLEILTLQVDVESEEDEGELGNGDWAFFKELKMLRHPTTPYTGPFWSWLWARCGHVKKLEVASIDATAIPRLVDAMVTYMPNLDAIQVSKSKHRSRDLKDEHIATLLSGSGKGWKVVDFSCSTNLGKPGLRTLTRHFSTLEEVVIDGCHGIPGDYIVQLLSFCPNLRTLVTIDDGSYSEDEFTTVSAEVFIDQVPSTGALKSWSCETSLKVLKVKIGDIPRPDLRLNRVVETYPGQGQVIQHLVYERIARLTNLEILWFGHDPKLFNLRYEDQDLHSSCLEMSLESGLGKLFELHELKELNMSRMERNTGIKTIQWMVQCWPKLHTIYGLDRKREGDIVAVEWLEKHSPWVKTPSVRYENVGYVDDAETLAQRAWMVQEGQTLLEFDESFSDREEDD